MTSDSHLPTFNCRAIEVGHTLFSWQTYMVAAVIVIMFDIQSTLQEFYQKD